MKRDMDKAVEQISATIVRHLVDFPVDRVSSPLWPRGLEMVCLTEANILNLARHLVMSIDEYGRTEEEQ